MICDWVFVFCVLVLWGGGGGAFGVSSWVGRWWLSGWVGGFAVGEVWVVACVWDHHFPS